MLLFILPATPAMKVSAAKLGYGLAILIAVAFAALTLGGPQGVPALIQKKVEIQELEKRNAALAREIEQRKERIDRLRDDPTEQELEIRSREKLVRPDEKVFFYPP
jgi:cell division protein FtsB